MGFKLVSGFIELLKLIITSKAYALTVLHTSQIAIGHIRSSKFVTVFTSSCLVAASNSGRSPSSGFPNYPPPQLPASHSDSSQQLNPSGYLADWLTNQLTHEPNDSSPLTACLSGLNSLYSPGMDDTENTVPLLQCSCCLAMAWHIPLLCAQPSAWTVQKITFLCFCLRAAA
jgi:hypothetical protein